MDDRGRRLITKAEQALTQGNTTSAQLALSKLRRQYADAPELAILEGQLPFFSGDLITGTRQLTDLSGAENWTASQYQALLTVLVRYELYFPAVRVLRRLCTLLPDDVSVKSRLAQYLLQTGDVTDAISLLHTCIERDPDSPGLHLLAGHAYKALPDTEKAAAAYHRYIRLQPATAGSGYWSLADLKHYRFTDDDEATLQTAHSDDPFQCALLCFARHHMFHQRGNKKAALQQLHEANRLMCTVKPFNRQGFLQLVDDLHNVSLDPTSSVASHVPVFIVGLPRSGTTLTEQILAAHSQITTTDELPYIERIALHLMQRGQYPSGLAQISESEKTQLRQFYFEQACQYPVNNHTYFIDKNPNNILHLGLIRTLFPDSPIICLSRPVLDNASSLYRQFFSHGNDYAYSPSDISTYIQGFYRLLALWQTKLGDRVTVLDYQALAESPEATIKGLFCQIGIAFEADCLTFHQADSPVLTPSASQVRQPISTRNIGSGDQYAEVFATTTPSIAELTAMRDAALGKMR
ncbi:sulfotransferase [Alteromonas halophila]|uniref:Sulfotransferase family protein n=1 Tax=Alteromonas halophila TaxID=516698 RepID=A0A918JFY5_9ALTE|nr:sulfotransferase [Alteromonas halophila]GGW74045.1 hypothetical protein GCM10007391_02280 [Alteromonas halophila]